jgi:YHS domain-containing protein
MRRIPWSKFWRSKPWRSKPWRGVWLLAAVLAASWAAPVAAWAEDGGWRADYDSARAESERTGRPLLIHFHATWCQPCRLMERDVLRSPELAAELERRYVGVKVDFDQHPALAKRFGVRSLPADVIVSPRGEVLAMYLGRQSKDLYLARLARYAPRQLPGDPFADPSPDGPIESADPQIADTDPPDPAPVGLNGYSPISLYEWREWRKGQAAHTARYQGIEFQFVNDAERKKFELDPDRYVPRLLGCDPVVLYRTDRAMPGSTEFGAYFDGALYLFTSPQTRTEFKEQPMRYTRTRHVLRPDDFSGTEIE